MTEKQSPRHSKAATPPFAQGGLERIVKYGAHSLFHKGDLKVIKYGVLSLIVKEKLGKIPCYTTPFLYKGGIG